MSAPHGTAPYTASDTTQSPTDLASSVQASFVAFCAALKVASCYSARLQSALDAPMRADVCKGAGAVAQRRPAWQVLCARAFASIAPFPADSAVQEFSLNLQVAHSAVQGLYEELPLLQPPSSEPGAAPRSARPPDAAQANALPAEQLLQALVRGPCNWTYSIAHRHA